MIYLQDFLRATGGQLWGAVTADVFTNFCYDSRIAEPGQLFLAVVTETGDGHDYIHDACERGAVGVVCQRVPENRPEGVTWILVENTQQALLDYARYILQERGVEVIGVTGSVGKTSTKETIATVLGARYAVFRNRGNFSGRYGLPIALGELADERLAVLEMAADSLDEIWDLAEITRPQVGIVTRIGHSHLMDLGSIDAIASEMGRLVEALPPTGVAILNEDDPRVRAMASLTAGRVVTFGLSEKADFRGEVLEVSSQGTRCLIHEGGTTVSAFLPLIGAHHVYTALAAYAAGRVYGLGPHEIVQALAQVPRLPGRLNPLPGIRGSLLLDDSFDACPESAHSALEALQALPAQRRWLVLGDIPDLGERAEAFHREVGRRCIGLVDFLITKGEQAQWAAQAALAEGYPSGRVLISFSDEEILAKLRAELGVGDVVLFKGGGAARLERLIAPLLASGIRPEQVLPRQHEGWQAVRLQRPGRPTWVEIDLGAIANNTRRILEHLGPGVKLMAVLKADAYGHGAQKVARTVLNNGATWLGVACLGEAIDLRRAGIDAPILNLGFTPPWQAREAVRYDVVTTVFSQDVAEALARAARDLGKEARVHVKVDTGMGRLGLFPEQVLPFVERLVGLEGVIFDGLFSHFAAADDPDLSYTYQQLSRFEEVVKALRARGLLPAHVHIANSAATFRVPESHYNMVRVGIALYGLAPSAEAPCPPGFRPALAFKCQIAQVKEMPAGSPIGYGCTYRTLRPSRIAVIPVGYADGFRRAPFHWGYVLVRGKRAPIVGRVCMDQSMIDVTDIPGVREGDEVVLIGTQGGETITAEEVAERLGTIHYEVVSQILARVPRVV